MNLDGAQNDNPPDVTARSLDIEIGHTGGRSVTVRVAGEIDAFSSGQLATCLDHLGGSGAIDVTIDLGEVPFIDSAGLRVLVGAALRLQEAGGRLELANVSKGTRRLFEITGLIHLLMP